MLQELEGEQNGLFHNLDITFKLQRRSEYYIQKIVFLFTFIFTMAACSFLVAASDSGTRTGITVTCFLTAVAFHFVIVGSLPKVSYSTRMDHFMVFMYTFIFLAYLENILIFNLVNYYNYSNNALRTIDFTCLGLYMGVGVLTFLWFLAPYIRQQLDPTTNRDYKLDIPPRKDYIDPVAGKPLEE